MIFVTSYQPPEILQPSNRSLNLPPTAVATERAAILCARLSTVRPMRAYQFDSTSRQAFTQWIAVRGHVVDKTARLTSKDSIFEKRFNEGYFMGAGTCRIDANGEAMTIGKHHDLGALATLCLPNLFTPFFADENVPSANDSSWLRRPSRSSRRTNRAQAFLHTPDRVQLRCRRQHVVAEGKCVGMSFQRAPLRNIHKMPSTQGRDAATGRPPLGPTGDSGNRSLISCHRSSLSSKLGSVLDPSGGLTTKEDRFFMSASFRLHSIRQPSENGLASRKRF